MRRPAIAMVAALAVGCGGDEGDDATAGSLDSGPGETGVSSGGDGGGTRLDVGDGENTAEGGSAEGGMDECKEVDFLFVIDSSKSMETNQWEVIRSFPEFAAGIEDLFAVNSYHVGVVTSDAYPFNADGCQEMGALVTKTGGLHSSVKECGPFSAGARYMTELDDLETAFECTAAVGTEGDNTERMAQAMLSAVDAPMNGSGACNEGFIRDSAILVVVLITDEDDPGHCTIGGNCGGTEGDPPDWYDQLVQLKGAENLVGLALVRGAEDNVCEDATGSEIDSERIKEFIGLFGKRGLVGDICAESFGPFFAQAVGLIDSACAETQG